MKDIGRYVYPNREALKKSIDLLENLQTLCAFQLEVGLWASVDFPSRHHINRLLSLQYRPKQEVEHTYGEGFAARIYQSITLARAYLTFVKGLRSEAHEKMEDAGSQDLA
jgi:hypothetical protein